MKNQSWIGAADLEDEGAEAAVVADAAAAAAAL
jgi:hypothetical protein